MIVVLMGVSGSGKTTIGQLLARDLGWLFIEGDDYHSQESIAKMKRGISLTDADRSPWLDRLANLVKQLDLEQQQTIIACSALKKLYRDKLTSKGAFIRFVHLKADYQVIATRLSSRTDHYMPLALLESQFEDLEELEEAENAIIIDASQPVAEVVKKIRTQLTIDKDQFIQNS